MKTKTYRAKNTRLAKSYLKPTGHGYEVGFVYGPKTIFVGNFVLRTEATRWFTQMNWHVRNFSRRYVVAKNVPRTWFGNFLSAYLYRCYYTFVNGVVKTHARESTRGFTKNVRKYQKLARRWEPRERKVYLKAN